MELISRRDAGKLLLAGSAGLLASHKQLFAAKKINSIIRGVRIGAQSYSFRDRDLDACLAAFREAGLGECELFSGHVEPRGMKREEVRTWHLTVPLSHFQQIRGKFNQAGVFLYAYNVGFRGDMKDEEIERGFQEAKALGVKVITSSANVSVAPRVDMYARKHRITVAFHGHDATDMPDEFSTPDSFARALKGASKYLGINLDIGHFYAAGEDPVKYLRENHAKIVCLHLKDRKRNRGKERGPNLPFGEGETPIIEILRMVRDQRWKIPCNIEYEYGGPKSNLDAIAEVKKCFAYCKKALEG